MLLLNAYNYQSALGISKILPSHEKEWRKAGRKVFINEKRHFGQCFLFKEIVKVVVTFCRVALQELVGILILQIPGSSLVGKAVEGGIFFECFTIHLRLTLSWLFILIVLIWVFLSSFEKSLKISCNRAQIALPASRQLQYCQIWCTYCCLRHNRQRIGLVEMLQLYKLTHAEAHTLQRMLYRVWQTKTIILTNKTKPCLGNLIATAALS